MTANQCQLGVYGPARLATLAAADAVAYPWPGSAGSAWSGEESAEEESEDYEESEEDFDEDED